MAKGQMRSNREKKKPKQDKNKKKGAEAPFLDHWDANSRPRSAECGRPSGGDFNSMIGGNTQLLCA